MDPASNHSAKYFISKGIDQFFTGTYEISRFILQFFKEVFIPPYEFREVIKQFYQIGCKSLPLISLTGFIVGIVFTDHSRPALASLSHTGTPLKNLKTDWKKDD